MKRIEKLSIGLIIVGVFVLCISIFLFSYNHIDTSKEIDTNRFNQLGGFISGTVGVIWSLASIALFYVTLREQREDFSANRDAVNLQVKALEQQIKEFELQRVELEETRKVFEEQSKTQVLQRFETTFFNLANVHHQIVNSIDYTKKNSNKASYFVTSTESRVEEILLGRDVFRYTYILLLRSINDNREDYARIYLSHYQRVQTDFGHYFRNLYRIIKFIDSAYFGPSKNAKEIFDIKYSYTSMIRAQLSDYELGWIFYNCLSENGIEKFKPLIERYCLFKNLDSKLIPIEEHISLYQKGAFDKNAIVL